MTISEKEILKSLYNAALVEAEDEINQKYQDYFLMTDEEKISLISCRCDEIMLEKIKKTICQTS